MEELNGRMLACQILITGLIARIANDQRDPLRLERASSAPANIRAMWLRSEARDTRCAPKLAVRFIPS
jgi:hypothetical protein